MFKVAFTTTLRRYSPKLKDKISFFLLKYLFSFHNSAVMMMMMMMVMVKMMVKVDYSYAAYDAGNVTIVVMT